MVVLPNGKQVDANEPQIPISDEFYFIGKSKPIVRLFNLKKLPSSIILSLVLHLQLLLVQQEKSTCLKSHRYILI